MDIGKEIRKARKARGMTLEALAHLVDSDTGNLSRFETGKQGASQELMTRIMVVLGMELVSQAPIVHSNVVETLQPSTDPVRYPVISWVVAGQLAETIDSFRPEDAEQWLESTMNAGASGFWLEVRGDSMMSSHMPTFPEGSLILVKPDEELVSGKYYVVRLADSGECTFKQYVEDAGHKYLRPLNPTYRGIEVTENCHFIGRVVDTRQIGL